MFGTLISVALNRSLTPAIYLRCSRCGAISGEPDRPYLLRMSTVITRQHGAESPPPEWICKPCGATGPIAADELVASNAVMRCRRTVLCHYSWRVPAELASVTCPRCFTMQAGPGL